ncbi:MAG: heavy-metal-associated domain-containing protein [Verrucomicrobiia bacterium]
MTCANCAVHVEKALEALPGVVSASVSLDDGAIVEHRGIGAEELERAVAAAGGYKAEILE